MISSTLSNIKFQLRAIQSIHKTKRHPINQEDIQDQPRDIQSIHKTKRHPRSTKRHPINQEDIQDHPSKLRMVFFKDITVSRQAYLVILDEEDQSVEKGTRLMVHEPLIGPLSHVWPKLTNPFHRASWTSEDKKSPTLWTLQSAHHQPTKDITPLQTLGRRITEGKAKWEDDTGIAGGFHYIKGYWEWTEDILSRCAKELCDVNLYDSVYASLFTYDRNNDVMKAFCEAWCPSTNTLLTSSGELSISLWDLQDLAGLPTVGTLYDEVVPSKKELFGAVRGGKAYIPKSCRYLFHAYHLLQNGSTGSQPVHVSFEEWIKFWSKNATRYRQPPPRKEKKSGRCKQSYSPTGDLEGHKAWTPTERSPFMKLDVDERYLTETYLAAYIVCWLCSFVLPEGDANMIRPNTFKMASIMAARKKVSLTVPVLASIYRGLNDISNSSEPSRVQSTFPVHFVVGWMAYYFETHFPLDLRKCVPKMIKFSGERGARPYDSTQARRRIHKWDQISWNCTTLIKGKSISYVDGENVESDHQSFFMAIRSNYLAKRQGDDFAIEPYSPHRFGRQFGYYQVMPGALTQSIREASLEDGFKYWRICLLQKSMSAAYFPSPPLSAKKFFSIDYKNWWDQVHKNVKNLPILTHPRLTGNLENQEENEEVGLSNGKRKLTSTLADSISSSVERHWNRQPKALKLSNLSKELDAKDKSTNEVEDILGINDQEDSLDNLESAESNHSVETHHCEKHDDFKRVPPMGTISVFDSKALFDDNFRLCFQNCWGGLRNRILRIDIGFMSSIEEEILEGIIRLRAFGYDISHLEESLGTLFARARDYDKARSLSFETGEEFARRLKEMKGHLAEEQAKLDKETKEIASLSSSLKSHRAAQQLAKNKVHDLKEAITKLKDHSPNDAAVAEGLRSSALLLQNAQKALEDQDPLA